MSDSTREVMLKLTSQKDVVKHQTSARTFEELKKEMGNIKWSGMRVVERATKVTLQAPDALLPAGDFVLFLVPEKVKSGTKTEGGIEKLKDIENASYNECRSHMSWLNRNKGTNFNMSGGTDDLRLRLMEYYDDKKAGKPKADKKAKVPAKKSESKKSTSKTDKKVEEKKANADMSDPIAIIEDCRTKINQAIDSIVQNAIRDTGGSGGQVFVTDGVGKRLEVIPVDIGYLPVISIAL